MFRSILAEIMVSNLSTRITSSSSSSLSSSGASATAESCGKVIAAGSRFIPYVIGLISFTKLSFLS